jgi:hypothetical protein
MTSDVDALTNLSTLLKSADLLVREYLDDPLRRRLLAVFERMPEEDRDAIVGVLEREVTVRLSAHGGNTRRTGVRTHVNPHAQLYLRSFDQMPKDDENGPQHDRMVQASLRSVAYMQMALAPEIHEVWRTATVEAFSRLDDAQRAAAAAMLRESLELLERAASARPAAKAV